MGIDPVRHRILYYEKIQREDITQLTFLPFYLVTYPGFPGKMFEPVDCLSRRDVGSGATADASAYFVKDVNELREIHNFSGMVNCEKNIDGTDKTLHSFSWSWPR